MYRTTQPREHDFKEVQMDPCENPIPTSAQFAACQAFEFAFQEMRQELLLPEIFGEPSERRKPAPSKIRYTCGGCGVNARGKPNLRLVCNDCERILAEAA
jgi:hypothetical protein